VGKKASCGLARSQAAKLAAVGFHVDHGKNNQQVEGAREISRDSAVLAWASVYIYIYTI
jgi:hypothetical protein